MRPVITIGTFDGVHLGHQFVLNETVKKAQELSTEAIAITYPRHPMEVLEGIQGAGYLLTEKSRREELIKKTGIKTIHYLDFDERMSKMKADDFLRNVIMRELDPKVIVVGHDTHFGVNRSGDAEFLRAKSAEYGYEVIELNPLYVDERLVSSSFVRELLQNGLVDTACKHLGYHYSVVSEVVHGKQIGRTLGYPTINQQPDERYKMIPGAGVYFTVTVFRGELSPTPDPSSVGEGCFFGATKVGVSPTIKTENVVEIETNLFDFSDDVYGQTVETYFIEKIRDEKKFGSIDELVKQIRIDTEIVRQKIGDFDKVFLTCL
jgi:riboflavin kinase/FMN adenylyltransferase